MKKNKILKLLNKLNGTNPKILEGFEAFDEGVSNLKSKLEQGIRISTIEEVETTINKFRKSIDLNPLLESIKQVEREVDSRDTELRTQLQESLEDLESQLSEARGTSKDKFTDIAEEIKSVKELIKKVDSKPQVAIPDFGKDIKATESSLKELISNVDKKTDTTELNKKIEKEAKDLLEALNRLRRELTQRINDRGGGNMNRNIAIGGNTSVLSMYTDINLKAGNNVNITYARNNTTKYTDITISATGGSSVGGTVRQIQTISTTTTIPTLAGTDQVYLCDQGIQVVLPTAVADTNLYTIKNVSNSSILVVGTIDNDVSGIIMPVKYTSVDIISNNVDWNIT